MTCPRCGGTVTVDPAAEADTTVFVQNRGGMPYLDRRRRPAVVAFCTACDYAYEQILHSFRLETTMSPKTPKTPKTPKVAPTMPAGEARPLIPAAALKVANPLAPPIVGRAKRAKPQPTAPPKPAKAAKAAQPADAVCARCGRQNSHGGNCRTRSACDARVAKAAGVVAPSPKPTRLPKRPAADGRISGKEWAALHPDVAPKPARKPRTSKAAKVNGKPINGGA